MPLSLPLCSSHCAVLGYNGRETAKVDAQDFRKIMLGIVATIIGYFLIIPTVWLLQTRHEILSALAQASSVRVEEYTTTNKVLATRVLSAGEIETVAASLPITFNLDARGLVKWCFVPHHRIIIAEAQGHETQFRICSTCSQMRLGSEAILPFPDAWQSSVRRMLQQFGIPVRESYRRV